MTTIVRETFILGDWQILQKSCNFITIEIYCCFSRNDKNGKHTRNKMRIVCMENGKTTQCSNHCRKKLPSERLQRWYYVSYERKLKAKRQKSKTKKFRNFRCCCCCHIDNSQKRGTKTKRKRHTKKRLKYLPLVSLALYVNSMIII